MPEQKVPVILDFWPEPWTNVKSQFKARLPEFSKNEKNLLHGLRAISLITYIKLKKNYGLIYFKIIRILFILPDFSMLSEANTLICIIVKIYKNISNMYDL